MIDKLIKNSTLITVNKNREILKNHSIAVKDKKIVDIAENGKLEKKYNGNYKVINGEGKYVFPGLINTHTHLFQTLLKGMGDNMSLEDWFPKMTAPSAVHLKKEDMYAAARLGILETIQSGTTTLLDYMYAHPQPELSDPVIEAFKELKLRGIFGRGTHNTGQQFGNPEGIIQDIDTIENDARRLLDKHHNSEGGRIKVWLAPAAIWTNSKKLLKVLWELTQEYNTGLTAHISETPFDRQASQEIHGNSDIKVLEELGIVGPEVLLVHCVHLTDRDKRMIKHYDMKVSHNPVSNMYLASGVADIPGMIEREIQVSLATDGPASNNSQDMIEVLKSTALLHKVSNMDPTIITAEKVLEMATIDGAKTLGMEDEIGSIEVGKKADLFIYNPKLSAKSIPMNHPVSTLVYSGSDRCVETVLVDGNIIFDQGKLITGDQEKIINQGQKAANGLAKRAGLEHIKNREWSSIAF